MGFWSWISGKDARERRWLAAPRLLPEHLQDKQPGVNTYFYTPEIYGQKSKNLRTYCIAERTGEGYRLYKVKTDHRDGTVAMVSGPWSDGSYQTDPLEIVRMLFSAISYRDSSWQILAPADETYTQFAHRHGIQFNAEGYPYMPDVESAKVKSVTLFGDKVNTVFNAAASKQDVEQVKTWAGLRAHFAPAEAVAEEFRADKNFDDFAYRAVRFLKKIEKIRYFVTDDSQSTDSRIAEVEKLTAKVRGADAFSSSVLDDEALRLVNGTALQGVIIAGAVLVQHAMASGKMSSPGYLDLVDAVAGKAVELARQAVPGLTREQASVIRDVMVSGDVDIEAPLPLRAALQEAYSGFNDAYNKTHPNDSRVMRAGPRP